MQWLGIMAKYWQPGEVKTRLARSIGPQRAAEIARASLATLLARFSSLADRRVLAFTPLEQEMHFAALAGVRWELQPQGEGDLGRRMQHFFDHAFAQGAERVVLIGADSPTLPTAIIDEAFAQLARARVVLGPADDGGYYLIGAREQPPPCLDRIAWGTPEVWEQSLARLSEAGCTYEALAPSFDIDDADDLARLQRELAAAGADEPQLIELAAELRRILR